MSETKIQKYERLQSNLQYRSDPDYEYHVRDFLAYACDQSFVRYLQDLERDAQLHALTPDEKDAELIRLREAVKDLRITVDILATCKEGRPQWPTDWLTPKSVSPS